MQQAGIEVTVGGAETATQAADLTPGLRPLPSRQWTLLRTLQVQERPVSAEDLARHFKPVAKAQLGQRLQQIDNLLQTLQGLGLLRRTEGGQDVRSW